MFNIVLVHPEIPPNTGNVIRLAANTGCACTWSSCLVFDGRQAAGARAGSTITSTPACGATPVASLVAACAPAPERCFAFTTRATRSSPRVDWRAGDWLVFGSESAGLPADVRDGFAPAQRLRLPMRAGQRSLNLSNAVAVAVFEAWRCNGYAGAAEPTA